MVREASPGLEVRLQISLKPLDHALGLRVFGFTEIPVEQQLAAETGISVGGTAAASVKAPLSIPDHQFRKRPERPQTTAHPPEHVRCLLAENQRTRTDTGIPQTSHDDPRPAGLAMTDGNMLRGLPEIPLADLPRPINRALMRARPREQWAHLTQIIIDDRLATIEPERLDQLTDPHPRQLRVPAQQIVNLLLERVELRRTLNNAKRRRAIRTQRSPDRVARQPGATHQLLDRHPTNEMLPTQLGPTLHVQHDPSPGLDNNDRTRLHATPDASATAQQGQFSTGEEGSVSHRHRQLDDP